MSRHIIGDLVTDCSVDVMHQGIINLMPEWEQHIAVDPMGRYDLRCFFAKDNNRPESSGVHIVVPGPSCHGGGGPIVDLADRDRLMKEKGLSQAEATKQARKVAPPTEGLGRSIYADHGFKRKPDGSWDINVDSHGFATGDRFSGIPVTEEDRQELGHDQTDEPTTTSYQFGLALATEIGKMRQKKLIEMYAHMGYGQNLVESEDEDEVILEFDCDPEALSALLNA